MGKRKVLVRESVVRGIAEIAWFIESKGLIATAENFSDDAYDFIDHLADEMVVHSLCKEPVRNLLGQNVRPSKRNIQLSFSKVIMN
jgi:hypothetical protein